MKTLIFFFATVVVVIMVGTIGYRLIEGWTLLESLYMTVITVFTVGFKEVRPLSTAGLVVTMIVIIVGVGAILYGLGRMVEFVIGGQLSGAFKRGVVRNQPGGHAHSHRHACRDDPPGGVDQRSLGPVITVIRERIASK